MPRRSDRGYGSRYIRAYTMRGDDWTREAPGSEIPFTASTGAIAKDKMSLRPDRWKVDNYHRSGGPVLWQHDHSRPAIGNGRAMVEPKRLRVHAVFDQEDDFARAIESKLRRRVLRSSSVGWNFVDESGEVLANQRLSPHSLTNFAWQSLDEMSVVNVGSDPFAIAERAAYTAHALRSIHPGLVDLYSAQEREDSDVTAPELRRALIDYCRTLGLDLRYIRAAMSTQEINDLPDSAFAYIEPGGGKDDEGKTAPRSLRHFPIHDKAHVMNALSRMSQSPHGEHAMPKILKAAKKFGIDVDTERAAEGWTRAAADQDEYDDVDAVVEDETKAKPRRMKKPKDADGEDMAEIDGEEQEDTEEDEDKPDNDDESQLVRRSQLPALLRAHGLDPKIPGEPVDTPPLSGVDRRAAEAILNAFAPLMRA